MKYLKTFEAKTYYNVDDYVLIKDRILIPELSRLGRIDSIYQDPDYYDIILPDNKKLDMSGRLIQRLLTPEEIEQYEAEKIAHKYNL